MKIHHIAVLALTTTVGASPAAHGAPPVVPTQVTGLRINENTISAYAQADYPYLAGWETLDASSYEDRNGVALGWIRAERFDWIVGTSASITCAGPEYARIVSVNAGNGVTIVNVTLDPLAPGCSGFGVATPLTVNLSGAKGADYSSSVRGTEVQQSSGVTTTSKFESTRYEMVFNGTGAFVPGPFYGSASATRYSERVRIR